MNKKQDGDLEEQTETTTDSLISEALDSLESQKREDEEEDGIVELPKQETDGQRVAKIDVQQVVNKETYMLLAADFDNFRKRALKERHEWERQGQERILTGFLDILDNLARGVQQASSEEGALIDGMRMVLSQSESWLSSLGLERIPALGAEFDPSVHDAAARVDSPQAKDGEILEEIKRGYRWKNSDRLLRPASVVVCKKQET